MPKSSKNRQTVTCPFCGTSYTKALPASTEHLSCRYCGATFFVPLDMGGSVHRCVNHPKNQAIGLCEDCEKSYCDGCLHVVTSASFLKANTKLYLCPSCLRRWKHRTGMKTLSLGIVLISVTIFLSRYTSLPEVGQPVSSWQIILIAFTIISASLGVLLLAYSLMFLFIPEQTIREKKK